MSTLKHTPGPWSAYISKRTKTIAVEIGLEPKGDGKYIISWPGFEGSGTPFKEQIHNARLIAAAPDLLAALKDCREALRRAGAAGELAVVDAAIAKAEGAQP